MAGKLSTHVLDIASGKPAVAMRVQLFWVEPDGTPDVIIRSTSTNADGRTDGPMIDGDRFSAGTYKLVFHVAEYYASQNHPDARRFLDRVHVHFVIEDAAQGYHVPLLVSPWAFSTYRGS